MAKEVRWGASTSPALRRRCGSAIARRDILCEGGTRTARSPWVPESHCTVPRDIASTPRGSERGRFLSQRIGSNQLTHLWASTWSEVLCYPGPQTGVSDAVRLFAIRSLMELKTVVILANSVKKKPGRCIAGREVFGTGTSVSFGPWIRPVSPDGEASQGELMPQQHCLTSGKEDIEVLSIYEIPLARQRSDHGQPENWDVVTGRPWKRVGSLNRPNLQALIEELPHLWDVGAPGERKVHVDAPLDVRGNTSLALIRPSGFKVWVQREQRHWHTSKTTMRGVFEYQGRDYEFDITDDSFAPCRRAAAQSNRTEFRPPFGDDCALCVSLGTPYFGYHYKLIAAVIPLRNRARSST